MRIKRLHGIVLSAFLAALLCIGVTAGAQTESGSSTDVVGVPAGGFTVKGLDLPARALSPMIMSELTKASCYGDPGSFTVVETDPDILSELQKEIDASNSEGFDPSTRMQNRWLRPNKSVSGSWNSDGTTLTATLWLTDTHGNVLITKSVSGPDKDFFDITEKVGKELADAMCKPRWRGVAGKPESPFHFVYLSGIQGLRGIWQWSVQGDPKFSGSGEFDLTSGSANVEYVIKVVIGDRGAEVKEPGTVTLGGTDNEPVLIIAGAGPMRVRGWRPGESREQQAPSVGSREIKLEKVK
jgi:hypothetical protein